MKFMDYRDFPIGTCIIVPIYINRWEMRVKRWVERRKK